MEVMKNSNAVSNTVKLVELKHSLVPARWEDTVRTVDIAEYKEAALSLAHAFATDEYAKYLVTSEDMADRSPEEKWKLHVDIMSYAVAAHCYDGLVTTIGPDYDSVALWWVVRLDCCSSPFSTALFSLSSLLLPPVATACPPRGILYVV